jgi:RimJ/RimL family protein N-acetyltransferase
VPSDVTLRKARSPPFVGLQDSLFASGLHRISAECDARDRRSMHLLQRVGFRIEGYRPSNTWIAGEWTDDLLFGLLAD